MVMSSIRILLFNTISFFKWMQPSRRSPVLNKLTSLNSTMPQRCFRCFLIFSLLLYYCIMM